MLKGGYLRVLTPITSDGMTNVMTEEGPDGKKRYKESHLHINAKKIMEAKNEKLPSHLKHIIEVVPAYVAPEPKAAVEQEEISTEEGSEETKPATKRRNTNQAA